MNTVVYGRGPVLEFYRDYLDSLGFAINPTVDIDPRYIISIQGTRVFTREELQSVDYMAWNLHNAPLPSYCGFNCIKHALANEDRFYGTSMHWISKRIDAGDLAFVRGFQVFKGDSELSLYYRSMVNAVFNFGTFLRVFLHDPRMIPRIPQVGVRRYYSRES